jgi:hypothetical protein
MIGHEGFFERENRTENKGEKFSENRGGGEGFFGKNQG